MPANLVGLKVFIASPGNLKEERKAFLQTIQTIDSDDAPESGVTFIPKGHEFAYGGVGRAQEIINQQIRESDYMIVLFWDQWGSATSNDGTYGSGTEEEFEVAMQCLQDPNSPMLDVVVLFKGVDDRQLSDPGKELQKVLAFKSRLEEERIALYETFDTTAELESKLRRQFQRWIRTWSSGTSPEKAVYRSRPSAETESAATEDLAQAPSSELEKAKALAKRGRITDAEQLFAQLITGAYDGRAFSEYAKFLRKLGRYSASERTSSLQLEAARDNGDFAGEVDALANLGIIKRLVGHKSASEMHFKTALGVIDNHEAERGVTLETRRARAVILDNLAQTLRKTPDMLDEASSLLTASMRIREEIGDLLDKAKTMRTFGVIASQRGRTSEAAQAFSESLRVFESEGADRERALTLSYLGEVLEQQFDLEGAESSLETALALNTAVGNRQGRSMNLTQLSRVLLAQAKTEQAMEYAKECVELNERGGSAEGLAAGLHALGRAERALGRMAEAEETLSQSFEAFNTLDQPFGIAAVSVDLAWIRLDQGDSAGAVEHASRARAILERTPHAAIQRTLAELLRALD